jgi:cyclic-di-GMP-binding protein
MTEPGELPELSASAAPEFVDPASCKAWLEHLPLANVAAAQREILAQLAQFGRLPSAAANRLAVLEALREAVHFVQLEMSRRFAYRALPMAGPEAAAFALTDQLWREMRAGYQRCLGAAANGETVTRAQAALVAQRLLACCGLGMLNHYRACREVAPQEWSALHAAYAAAERLEVAEEPVKDFLCRAVNDSSPRIAYARTLLMGLANPNELGQRQLSCFDFLLERWAAKLEIAREPFHEPHGMPPLLVDLASTCGAYRGQLGGGVAASARFLGTRAVSKSLRSRVELLRKGESPAKLALGEDCVQPSCEQWLVYLYRQWCQARPARSAERQQAAHAAQACIDLAAIHGWLAGDPAVAPEAWRLQDESALGLRLARSAAGVGQRYAQGQLIGVRADPTQACMLGQLRWLMIAQAGELHAGVRLLPGMPSAAAVRATGLNAQDESYVRALALNEAQALGAPACLVLAPGWFKPRRVIDMRGAGALRLTEVLERGLDFERVAYEAAG